MNKKCLLWNSNSGGGAINVNPLVLFGVESKEYSVNWNKFADFQTKVFGLGFLLFIYLLTLFGNTEKQVEQLLKFSDFQTKFGIFFRTEAPRWVFSRHGCL